MSRNFAIGFGVAYTYQSFENVECNAHIVKKPEMVTSYVFNALGYIPFISMIIAIARLILTSIQTYHFRDNNNKEVKALKAFILAVDWAKGKGYLQQQEFDDAHQMIEKYNGNNNGYITGQWLRVVFEMLNLGLLLALVDIIMSCGGYCKPSQIDLDLDHNCKLIRNKITIYEKEMWEDEDLVQKIYETCLENNSNNKNLDSTSKKQNKVVVTKQVPFISDEDKIKITSIIDNFLLNKNLSEKERLSFEKIKPYPEWIICNDVPLEVFKGLENRIDDFKELVEKYENTPQYQNSLPKLLRFLCNDEEIKKDDDLHTVITIYRASTKVAHTFQSSSNVYQYTERNEHKGEDHNPKKDKNLDPNNTQQQDQTNTNTDNNQQNTNIQDKDQTNTNTDNVTKKKKKKNKH